MAELAFMFLIGVVVTVDFLVRLLCFVCESDDVSVGLAWILSCAVGQSGWEREEILPQPNMIADG